VAVTAVEPGSADVARINAVVVEMLEGLLAEAREGRVRAVAAAVVYVDGATTDMWAAGGGLRRASMVGAIEIMKARYVAELVEETNP